MKKDLPFTKERLLKITQSCPTPFHIYDEKAIRENARALYKTFDWVDGGFINYFAVKALPNPRILQILKEEGMGADCSSLAELVLAQRAGLPGDMIMFTSNDTPAGEFVKAKELGAVINLDDISHIEYLEKVAGLPGLISCRYNPGPLKQGNEIIGHPEEAKYGFTREQLFEAYALLKQKGVKHFGLHTMVASNEIDPDYFIETTSLLFDLAAEISKEIGITFSFINLGGGIGIPYKPEQKPVDMDYVSKGIHEAYKKLRASGHPELRVCMECGRMITGPYGYLVSTVRHMKHTYKDYAGLDSCMANLMRPGMYGAYHHISVPGKTGAEAVYDVVGSLCENNDKFAINRNLPRLEPGDLVVIHDTGAHGHSMGFNYNGKLRSAELLLKEDGSVERIRRAETIDDYFATLDF